MTLKRGIACFVLMSILLSFWIPVNATEKISVDDKQSFAVSVALGLGIVDAYEPDREVTVGEFKNALDRLVTGGKLHENYLKNADDKEIIKTKDALAIMCDVLGYSGVEKVSKNEKSMLSLARENDLLAGVTADISKKMVVADFVNLFYNTLTANPYVAVVYGTERKIEKADYMYMEKALGYYIINGVVERTSFSSIVPEGGTEGNTIVVNDVSYKCETAKYEDFVGKSVQMIVHHDSVKEVVVIHDDSSELYIDADDIDKVKLSSGKITYYDQDKVRSVNLSKQAAVLYNFKFLRDVTDEDLKIKQGRLVLIDNDFNGRYDVIKVEEYKSMEVFAVSIETGLISDNKGNSYNIEELVNNEYPIYNGDERITAVNIPLGTIGTIWLDKAGNVMRIHLGGEAASGTIVRMDKQKNVIQFAEAKYSYVDEIEEEIEKLTPGKLINVSLNMYGEITTFEIASDTWKYGYMVGFTSGALGNVEMKVFTETGEFVIYKLKGRIRLNDVEVSTSEAFAPSNIQYGFWDEAGKITQIIKYKAGSDHVIKAILTTADVEDGSERMVKEKDGVYNYYSDSMTIASNVRLNTATKVFAIPTELSYEAKFKAGTFDVLKRLGRRDSGLTFQIYDVDKNRYAGVVVARFDIGGKGTVDDFSATPYIVEDIGTCIGEYEEEATVLTVRSITATDNTTSEWIFNSEDLTYTHQSTGVMISELKKGDILFASSEDIYKSNFKLIYRDGVTTPYEEIKDTWNNAKATVDNFYAGSNMLCAGKIVRIIEDGFIANFKPDTAEYGSAWDRVIPMTGTEPVWIMDSSRDELYQGSPADITENDEVFVYMKAVIPKAIIIYR